MPEISPSKYMVQAGWDSVPHLSAETQRELLASTPPFLRDARSKGIPSLGAGAIYPIPFEEISVDPFKIPAYWPKAYALDVGWNRTAALWGAWDRDIDCIYLYTEHYRGQAEPSIHASAIKARGDWIPGLIDPAARGRAQTDGEQLAQTYRDLGLKLTPADNTLTGEDSGLFTVWERLSTGRLKVFTTLQNWVSEYRLYRRNEKGAIVKKHDHLMDCLHPDTIVHTRRGGRRIAELVGTAGEVLTVGGGWAGYRDCRLIGRDRAVVSVKFDDGTGVTCTGDHLFLTPTGWVEAIGMAQKYCYDAVSQSIHRNASCASPSFRPRSKSSWGFATTCAAHISSVAASAFIAWCGKHLTGDQFQPAGISITATRTRPTTSRAIWNWLSGRPTLTATRSAMGAASRQPQPKPRETGTHPLKGWRGIESTIGASPKRCTSGPSSPANTAERRSSHRKRAAIASAPITAKLSRAASLAWTMLSGAASAAAPRSRPTNTQRPKHADAHVLRRCVSVESAGRSDVYCLTVPETAAFAVAGGVVVHNCTRYLVRGMPTTAIVQPIKRVPGAGAIIGDRSAGY